MVGNRFCICAVVLSLLLTCAVADAREWNVQTAFASWSYSGDSGGRSEEPLRHLSLAVDNAGVPHVAYAVHCWGWNAYGAGETEDVRYAKYDSLSNSWSTAYTTLDPGGRLSLKIDAQGNAHLAGESSSYRVSADGGYTWSSSSLSYGPGNSIALDSHGNPRVSYARNDGKLTYYSYEQQAWFEKATAVDGLTSVGHIALDAQDYPILPFSRSGYVRYAYIDRTTNGWKYSSSSTAATGVAPSLAVDANGKVHFTFSKNGKLCYATAMPGGALSVQEIDACGYSGDPATEFSSLLLDAAGIPHVAYYDKLTTSLKLASWNVSTSSWVKETIDQVGDVGLCPSAAMDLGGIIHIAYYDATNAAIKYAVSQAVPEPAGIIALLSGCAGIACRFARRRNR